MPHAIDYGAVVPPIPGNGIACSFLSAVPEIIEWSNAIKACILWERLRFLAIRAVYANHTALFSFFRIPSSSIKITFLTVEFLNWYIKGRMQNSEAYVYLNTYMYVSIYFSDVKYSSHNSLESWDRILIRIKENPCLLRGCHDDTSWFNYHLKFDRNVVAGWNLLCQ